MPDTVLDAGDTAGHSEGAKPRPFSRGFVRPTCVFPFEADILKLEGSMLHVFFFFFFFFQSSLEKSEALATLVGLPSCITAKLAAACSV